MEEKVLAGKKLAGGLRSLLGNLVNLVRMSKFHDRESDDEELSNTGQIIDARELLDKFTKLVWTIRQQSHENRMLLIQLTVELFNGSVCLQECEFASYCDYVIGLGDTVSQHASEICPITIDNLNFEYWLKLFEGWSKQVNESQNYLAQNPQRYGDWLYRCCEKELRTAEHKLLYPATPIKPEFVPYFPTEFDEILNGQSFAESLRDTSPVLSPDDVMSPRKPTTRVYLVKDLAAEMRYRSMRIQGGNADYGRFFEDPVASDCLCGIKQLLYYSDKEDQKLYEMDPWRFMQEKLLNSTNENYYDWPLSRLVELIQIKLEPFVPKRKAGDSAETIHDDENETEAETEGQAIPKGVSLLDAAMSLNEDDSEASSATKKRWVNCRDPKLPKPIGLDSKHKQAHLFEINELLGFIGIVEGIEKVNECRKRLRPKLRFVRPSVNPGKPSKPPAPSAKKTRNNKKNDRKS